MSHNKDVPSWRLLHQDHFVDSNPRIELVGKLNDGLLVWLEFSECS